MKTQLMVLALVGLATSVACSDRPREEEEPEVVIEHRVEPCTSVCRIMADPVCGIDPNVESNRLTEQECIDECVVWDGDGSSATA